MQLPKIYPLTDPVLSGMSHAEQVRRLVEGGARFIQIREKRLSPAAFYDELISALEIARRADTKIIVNDRADFALAAGADGVHLGQTDLPADAARKLLGDKAIIGVSTHNLVQVEKALALPVDYIAFGPIFPTATKEKPDPVVGLAQLRLVREMLDEMPLVAIGGVNASNIAVTLEAGADSVALISEIFVDPVGIAVKFDSLNTIASGVQHL